MTPSCSFRSYRYRSEKWETVDAETIVETPVGLTVNGEAWLTFMCTPVQLEALAVGFLYNEGVLHGKEEVVQARLCEHGDNVDVWLTHAVAQPKHWRRTSGCTGGQTAVDALTGLLPASHQLGPALPTERILQQMDMLLEAQALYRETGGVHTSALSDGRRVVVSAEDIGRHNTLDKISGLCLMQDLWPEDRILMTTGRISSEMLQKTARLGATVLISRTSPSSLAIELADRLGITLIGYARRDRFNVYAHHERVRATVA